MEANRPHSLDSAQDQSRREDSGLTLVFCSVVQRRLPCPCSWEAPGVCEYLHYTQSQLLWSMFETWLSKPVTFLRTCTVLRLHVLAYIYYSLIHTLHTHAHSLIYWYTHWPDTYIHVCIQLLIRAWPAHTHMYVYNCWYLRAGTRCYMHACMHACMHA